ncbi:DODA-type extradiol aromatic ring-opening family dioxygenase [Aurantiacibacter sp. D1-12]|uniref:DODA-type extradiol aromatic ring-opening family dioxygenase n=1 Tax=Aurantiacibacter sp. D1-12 TaxID=2993658 RepID=UPI00237CC834|nr:class III extradiol ring-cleavage dioxygenase [Aurantiacibacter sp. D1-12]MDE1467968.1 class III extradiol ring-cleavage dioxygenase [Aurantiacibacter sp. D1-12]
MRSYPETVSGFYLSHGGGPLPIMGDVGHREMVEHLQAIGSQVRRPSSIIMISAHWEAAIISITSGQSPELIYDYGGFPEETYRYQYPAPGDPELASEIARSLVRSGIECRLDAHRGFDHGMFVPLMLMYPDADIPCVQVSLAKSLDPALHLALGKALAFATGKGAMIIGSGFSFHNMRAFRDSDTPQSRAQNEAFESWLIETCSNGLIGEEERAERLRSWEEAPFARYCHPREEHLLPLHVCYGAFDRPSSQTIELMIMNKKASMYLW